MSKIENYPFPGGLHLLTRWQSGDADAKRELTEIFDAAIAGEFDANFAVSAPANEIHATASVHMLALAVLHDLYGIESAEYYKTDAWRYVRANLTVCTNIEPCSIKRRKEASSCRYIGTREFLSMLNPDSNAPPGDFGIAFSKWIYKYLNNGHINMSIIG